MDRISELVNRLAGASRVTVLTGAGVSAASGVPTFRGAGGLWKAFRVEDLATPEAFARDPRLVWDWYDWRRRTIAGCRPNRAHEVLAAWSRRFDRFILVTQNVDGLHEAAGTEGLVRLHGSLWHLKCSVPCARGATPWRDDRVPLPELPPLCPFCGELARPAVVWFGEPLDPAVLERAADAARCDLFLAIGTSAVVYPAAGLLHDARTRGAFTGEINPAATDATEAVDLAVAGPAEVLLDQIEARLAGKYGPPPARPLANG